VRHDPHLASHGVSDAREINGLPRLGVRDAPNLEAIPKSRLCVLVDGAAGTFSVAGNKDDVYMIVKGY
jgi:hypothetical protein